jgi:hypothetical protein
MTRHRDKWVPVDAHEEGLREYFRILLRICIWVIGIGAVLVLADWFGAW